MSCVFSAEALKWYVHFNMIQLTLRDATARMLRLVIVCY